MAAQSSAQASGEEAVHASTAVAFLGPYNSYTHQVLPTSRVFMRLLLPLRAEGYMNE